MAQFFADRPQQLLANVHWLGQEGAPTGPTGRPMNSYALTGRGGMILIDAPFRSAVDSIAELAAEGHRPLAMFLTHAHVAEAADALAELAHNYILDVFLHPNDATDAAKAAAGVSFMDPRGAPLLRRFGCEVIEMPFHTPGSVMLHSPDGEGVLFAGDCAVAPGPRQPQVPARLELPKVAPEHDAPFREEWDMVAHLNRAATLLPLHGTPYVRRSDLMGLIATMLTSLPMDPMATADGEPMLEATGIAA